MNLNPPGEHELLIFWVGLVVVVALARGLGLLARKVGQPAVIGELAAGIVLGPSVLGRLAPDAFEWLFPADDVQTAMLFTVAWLGVVMLLVVTGYETDLALIRRLGRAAGIVSTGSLVVPMVFGLGVGLVMPSLFLGESGDRTVFALFLAAALSISSLPVIAKILSEMGFMRRDFGQLTLAAGMANDVVGWVLLGIVAGLAQAGSIEIGAILTTLAGLALFFGLAFTIGQRALDWGLKLLLVARAPVHAATGLVILFALAAGAITQWLGVEAVLGAFVAGVLLGRSRLRNHKTIEPIESLTTTFLAPVFFATAGLRVDLGLLGDPEVLLWAGIVLAAASLAKFAGSIVAAKIAGLPNREGAALGIGLNARGALEIVIATVGLSLGVLNQASYTVIVLMALATSMAAPPLLRRVLSGWAGTDEEQERLLREETLAANIIVRNEPVLIPTRGGMNSIMAAQLVDLAWPKEVGVTLATVDATGDAPNLRVLEDVLHLRSVERRLLGDDDVVDALVEELRLGYGTAVIGTSSPDGDRVLSPIAEELALRSPVPVTVVRRGLDVTSRLPPAYGRVLIPVTGTPSSIAAQEVGLAISGAIGTEAILTHVVHHDGGEEPDEGNVRRTRRWGGPDVLHRGGDTTRIAGQQMLDDAAARAATVGARAITAITDAESTAAGILQLVELHETDLVIVGATRRDVDGRLFLGHTVERLLRRCGATIVVVVSPSDRSNPPDA
ncbi:cation:proton antiporter [Acidimicrobiia bacterium EGI L10123]|uniref:cation:proton antiporter domain-containing protein n=1 Tax=Salinilacustrithrix flava TaxID=2957203 RepID=UPI003D7C177C|nr:cation:proton antiporter [Acidimicrobiia bacterium EGI L10123]